MKQLKQWILPDHMTKMQLIKVHNSIIS